MTRTLSRTSVAVALLALAIGTGACSSDDDDKAGASETGAETAAWGGVINGGGEPVRGGTLRVDQSGAPPAVSSLAFLAEPDNLTMQVVMQVFDQLVEFQPDEIDPQPGLAESWTVSDDGLTYTFKLRDAEFSNGMPVTSADVKWVLDRARGPKSFFLGLFGTIESVHATDPSTVVVKLSKPTPALLHSLATAGASIVPSKVVKAKGVDANNRDPIGSGPFLIQRWTPDQPIELAKNDRYWRKDRPYLDKVVLAPTQNDNTRVLNLESGTTDVADYVPFAQIERIDKSGSAKVLVAPGADMSVVFINNAKKPFDELGVRQALNYATPVKSIVDVVFHGHAPAMNTVLPKLKYWTDKAQAYPYDVEKAKQLLAKSSVPDGFSATISIDGSDSATRQVAQILRQSWRDIGVDLTIRPRELGVLGEEWPAGKTELTYFRPGATTSDVPIDDEFAALVFDAADSHNFFTWYENPITRRLARQAVVELDEGKRRQLFEQLHVESMRNPPVIPIVYTPNRAGVSDKVRNFNYMLAGFWRLDSVWKD